MRQHWDFSQEPSQNVIYKFSPTRTVTGINKKWLHIILNNTWKGNACFSKCFPKNMTKMRYLANNDFHKYNITFSNIRAATAIVRQLNGQCLFFNVFHSIFQIFLTPSKPQKIGTCSQESLKNLKFSHTRITTAIVRQ